MSLARAFQVAGCPTAVMSLWNLDDQRTASLMSDFYKAIAKGKSASESMYAARNFYLNSDNVQNNTRLAHPHYWAGMLAIGSDGPHLPQLEVNWPPWLIWGSITAFLIALWQQRRRRRRRIAHRKR